MITRTLTPFVQKAMKGFPVVTITGPRQSGKTTLAKHIAGTHYINLEVVDNRDFANNDPRDFLAVHAKRPLVIDEAQYAPKLFSYIQAEVDKTGKKGQFILTGSQNYAMNERLSQSLAGRTAIYTLLPFSISELRDARKLPAKIEDAFFKGGYPRVFQRSVDRNTWLAGYVHTYIQRDVRQLINVQRIELFNRFLKLCAARIGQLVNANAISNELGVDVKTIQSWISVLEATYIVFLLRPHHKNYNKRLVKTPKLYFHDTALATFLLGIESSQQLINHPLKGELFENMMVSDLMKQRYHIGKEPNYYFWRDNTGNEVDVLQEDGIRLNLYEIKSSKTYNPSFVKGLDFYTSISSAKTTQTLIYGGDEVQKRNKISLVSWRKL
jgi:uncharacterized protein